MTPIVNPDSQPRTGPGSSAPSRPPEKYILFDLSGQGYCVLASVVAEVVAPLPLTPLPEAPNWLMGLAAHRGEIVAVINPATLNPEIPAPPAPNAKLMLFRPTSDGTRFALPVDGIRELFTADPGGFDGLLPGSGFRSVEIIREGEPVRLIDHQAMFESFYTQHTPA